jgi:hypothetical protein
MTRVAEGDRGVPRTGAGKAVISMSAKKQGEIKSPPQNAIASWRGQIAPPYTPAGAVFRCRNPISNLLTKYV